MFAEPCCALHVVTGTRNSWSVPKKNLESGGMIGIQVGNYKAVRSNRGKAGSGDLGVAVQWSWTRLSALSLQLSHPKIARGTLSFLGGTIARTDGGGCLARSLKASRPGGGRGRHNGQATTATHQMTVAKVEHSQQQPAASTPMALTWWLLQACLLSLLLSLMSLEIIALILLTLIVQQDVFMSHFSLN